MAENKKGRRAAEEQARREHILSVTERLLARNGIRKTAVADIAREAEFGVGTIYKYFEDKDTLVESLLTERLTAHFNEMNAAIDAPGSPMERLERFIEADLASLEKRQEAFRVFFSNYHACCGHQQGARSDIGMSFLKEARRRVSKRVEAVFAEGVADGTFVDVEPRMLGTAFLGMGVAFYFEYEHNREVSWKLSEIKNAFRLIFFDRVLLPSSEHCGSGGER